MDKLTIVYTALPDTTPESELDALVAVYAFVLEAHGKKEAAVPSGQKGGVKENQCAHTKDSIPR